MQHLLFGLAYLFGFTFLKVPAKRGPLKSIETVRVKEVHAENDIHRIEEVVV